MTPITIPDNVPLLLTTPGLSHGAQGALKACISCPMTLPEMLLTLGNAFPVKVWFKEPVTLRIGIGRMGRWTTDAQGIRHRKYISGTKVVTEYVFKKIFTPSQGYGYGSLYYVLRKNGRKGYHMPPMDKIERFEPVIDEEKTPKTFSSYEAFRDKFDLKFISEDQIKKLYTETSAQTGERYTPSDFRRIGPVGHQTLRTFLESFEGVDATEPGGGYVKRSSLNNQFYHVLEARHISNGGNLGRDITISHRFGQDMVYYASEYPGCGNGRYGILANKNEYLWMEDD